MQTISPDQSQPFTSSDLFRRRFRHGVPPQRSAAVSAALSTFVAVAGVALLAAGMSKFAPHSEQVELYVRAGFPGWTLWLVGGVEMAAGAVALVHVARSSAHLVLGAVRRVRVGSASAPSRGVVAAGGGRSV